MPGFDGKGPRGEGPKTGRKAGKCTNFGAGRAGKRVQEESEGSAEETARPDAGLRGAGRGMGGGRGAGQGRRGAGGRGRGTGRGAGAGRGHGA
jgi:hypothetical protein